MCGIAGFFNYKSKHPVDKARLNCVLNKMHYRGPDDLGVFSENDVAIGNVRLAIQGIDVKGNQPIYNEDSSIVVVYNGEIYNYPEIKKELIKKGHIFYSNTDTEILVHLYEEYGINVSDELNGMFAFALFDRKKRRLILSRDRTAQKPLYINENDQGLFFSSELHTMIPYLEGCSTNRNAIRTFLSMGYALEPETIINEVITIEPASTYIYDEYGNSSRKYWDFNTTDCNEIIMNDDWICRADEVLTKAVKRHLISDVPITLFLSGGVDSSLLALYLSEQSVVKKTYTASFVSDKSHDEYSYADTLGKHCGFETERIVMDNSTLANNLEEFLARSSMPQGDYSGLATYSIAKEVGRSFKVVLGGDGADEIFGGYPTYTLPYLKDKIPFIDKRIVNISQRLAYYTCNRHKYMSLPFRLQQLSLACGDDIVKSHFSLKNFLPQPIADVILNKDYFLDASEDAIQGRLQDVYNNAETESVVKKLCHVDFCTFMRSATIPKVERNTMLFSLECRMPFLDNEVLDLSKNMHESLLVNKTNTKYGLKELLKHKTKSRVKINPIKQGFNPPLLLMLDNEMKEWKRYWMNIRSPFFIKDIESELSKLKKRYCWDTHRLEWNICVLNEWCYRYGLLNR